MRTVIITKSQLSEVERGQSVWKINNSHLHDPEYVEEITRMWYLHQCRKTDNDNINGWWEEGKTRIKEISLNFSKRKNREKGKHKTNNLSKQFRNIKISYIEIQIMLEIKTHTIKSTRKLENSRPSKQKEKKIRSKAQCRDDGETSSRYSCSLEKKRGLFKRKENSYQHFSPVGGGGTHDIFGRGVPL